jgi:hypothetical protein
VTDLDYAATSGAQHNRRAKADTLARWCWAAGVTPDHLAAAPRAVLNRAAREAGVNPPRPDPAPGTDTWAMVRDLLDTKTAWAAQHPDHPAAARPPLLPAGCVCLTGCAPAACGDCSTCTPPAPAPPAAAGSESAGVPRGWADLAALGPVGGRSCWCGEPAVRWVTTHQDGAEWRCAGHPPMPGDWGYSLNWAPRACVAPLRCYCGRCTPPAIAPLPRYSEARNGGGAAPTSGAAPPDPGPTAAAAAGSRA